MPRSADYRCCCLQTIRDATCRLYYPPCASERIWCACINSASIPTPKLHKSTIHAGICTSMRSTPQIAREFGCKRNPLRIAHFQRPSMILASILHTQNFNGLNHFSAQAPLVPRHPPDPWFAPKQAYWQSNLPLRLFLPECRLFPLAPPALPHQHTLRH